MKYIVRRRDEENGGVTFDKKELAEALVAAYEKGDREAEPITPEDEEETDDADL